MYGDTTAEIEFSLLSNDLIWKEYMNNNKPL